MKQGSIRVQEGQTVRAGDIIAEMGNSGYSSNTHLHYQVDVRVDGTWKDVDPDFYTQWTAQPE